MDKKSAKKLLLEHKDALEALLKSEGLGNVKAEVKELHKEAKEGTKALKKSLLQRVKELPVVDTVSQLGTAGTVAISTAAVTQADLAKNLTEVFVAEVANDVVEERFEVPSLINNIVDFHVLNDWGQVIIAEKVEAAQVEVAEAKISVAEPQQTSESSSSVEDTKSESSSSSQDNSSDNPSETESQESEAETESTEQESEESKSSEESKESDSEPEKQDTQEESQEQETESNQESQESSESSEQPTESSEPVKTAIETPVDEIKPHDLVVSPTS